MPTNDDSEGRVGLKLAGTVEEIQAIEKKIATHLQTNVFKPFANHTVKISTIQTQQDGQYGRTQRAVHSLGNRVEVIFELIEERSNKPVAATLVTDYLKSAYMSNA